MTTKVYTMGYTGRKPDEVKAIALKLEAVVFDIRFSPRSRNPAWNKGNMQGLLGARYHHMQALGNKNYRGGPTALVDYRAGLQAIKRSGRAVILMCACKRPEDCHRTEIAAMLRQDGCQVQEITPELLGAKIVEQSSFVL